MAQGKYIRDLQELSVLADDGGIEVQRSNSPAQTSWIKKSALLAELQLGLDTHTHIEVDVTDLDKYTQAEVDALLAAQTYTESQITDLDRVRPRGEWNGSVYEINDMAFDNGWVGVATAQTSDHIEAQPVGAEDYLIDLGAVPVTLSDVSVVKSKQVVTFTKGGYLKGIFVRVPSYSGDFNSRLTLKFGDSITIFDNPILKSDEWTVIKTGNTIVLNGTVGEITLETYNAAAASTITGGWTSSISTGIPANQEFNLSSATADGTLVIDHTDLDNVERTTELRGIQVGSVCRFVETADAARSTEIRITSVDTTNTQIYSTFTYNFVAVGGTSAIRTGRTTTVTIDVPVTQPTEYTQFPLLFATAPSFATVTSTLEYDGVDQAADPTDGYGMNVLFQPATVSPDWDIYAVTGASGSASGASNVYYTASLPATVLDVNDTYPVDVDTVGANDVQVRLQETVPEGEYMITFSSTVDMNSTTNQILTRISLDGGTTWEEASRASAGTDHKYFFTYALPITYAAQAVDIIMQIRKENATNTLNAYFANIILDGK